MKPFMYAAAANYIPGQGLPLGMPPGSPRLDPKPQVSQQIPQSRDPNIRPSSSDDRRRIRVGARQLARLAQSLSTRDRQILERLAEHRYLTTHQLQAFCFETHSSPATAARTTRRVLSRLGRNGLITTTERRIGGVRAGSSATVWALSAAGTRLLRATGHSHPTREPSPRFLAHCLAVADVHLMLLRHASIEPIESVKVEVEPACWRPYQGSGGEPRWLQPDLFAEVTASQFIDRFFIEVDLGTESLPTLLSKCGQYEAYRATGTEQATGSSFPLVLWLFTDDRRADKLRAAIRRSPRLTLAMFRSAGPDTLEEALAGGTP